MTSGSGEARNKPKRGTQQLRRHPGFLAWTVLVAALVAVMIFVIYAEFDPQIDPRRVENAQTGAIVFAVFLVIAWVASVAWIKAQPPQPMSPDYLRSTGTKTWRQCYAMVDYLTKRGKTPEYEDIKAVTDGLEFRDQKEEEYSKWRKDNPTSTEPAPRDPWKPELLIPLTKAHKNLSKMVSPALPETLVSLSFGGGEGKESEERLFPWLGSVRLVRMMNILVIALIPIFVALGLSVGADITVGRLFDESVDIFTKTQTALYLVVAAGLGAAFAALFKAFSFIGNLSYDQQYESSYWTRFVLGVVAGLILAIILSQALFSPNVDNDATFRITVPLLALVGGFSSDLVYRILKRIIDAIETLLQGSVDDRVAAAEQQTENRIEMEQIEASQRLIAALVELEEKLPDDATEARDALRKRLANELGADSLIGQPTGAATEPGSPQATPGGSPP